MIFMVDATLSVGGCDAETCMGGARGYVLLAGISLSTEAVAVSGRRPVLASGDPRP